MDRGRRGPRRRLGYARSVSLLADPPLLFANGEVYGRLAGRRAPQRRGKAFGAVVLTVFWGVSIPLYMNARWTRPLWRILPGLNGRDFMVNFPGLPVDTRRSGPRMHLLAAAGVAASPLRRGRGWGPGAGWGRAPDALL